MTMYWLSKEIRSSLINKLGSGLNKGLLRTGKELNTVIMRRQKGIIVQKLLKSGQLQSINCPICIAKIQWLGLATVVVYSSTFLAFDKSIFKLDFFISLYQYAITVFKRKATIGEIKQG